MPLKPCAAKLMNNMRLDILTIFPDMFPGFLGTGLMKLAMAAGVVEIKVHNLRVFSHDKHRTVDDSPFGGGPGMVMKPGPIFEAVSTLRGEGTEIILLSPQGRLLNHRIAGELAAKEHLILICGRYEGVDERVHQHLANREISIGDFLLSGGEVAAMAVAEAVVRLLPGALGSSDSLKEDSLAWGLLEYPHYTRPACFKDWEVPAELLSGNHAQIARWRREQALKRTWERRPDLFSQASLTAEDREILRKLEGAA